jgi:RNA recognition motif. (a.k.a. RRM, RBD, or RNP domain)
LIPSSKHRSVNLRISQVSYPYPIDFVIIYSVGLTNEWHRWFFPIRSLLTSLAFPAQWASTEAPFFSTRKAFCGSASFFRSSIVGKKLYVGNLTYNVNQSDLEALFTPFGTVQSA